MKKRYILTISGKVQGVWYRKSAEKMAKQLMVFGWIKNLPNGKVQADVEGEIEKIWQFIEWCKNGPELAEVEKVVITEEMVLGYTKFEIL